MEADEGRVDGRTLRYQHRRPELLAAATEYVLDNGIGDLSLRDMARALGVTHATLLRHFGGGGGGGGGEGRGGGGGAEVLRTTWKRLCDPAEQRQFALLFEVVGRASRDGGRLAELAQASIHDWLNVISAQLLRIGYSPKDADTLATVLLAQVRGLQIDLLLTGDRRRANRAIETLIDMIDRRAAEDQPQ